ncbi:hypothetical protein V5O48_003680 [Marasmius crinis-equi]|uniref:Uncharacterized protein n=1 Tax=Marasmius crinis-equi TaxID=585013 RepID=A0ABR3FS60_9AGAR
MDAFHFLPDSVPTLLFDNRRRSGGLYPHMIDVLSNMGKAALCNANFNVDFFRRTRVDNWSSNYGYQTSGNAEFTCNVFGEIVGEQYGTLLGPAGNHYPGRADEELRTVTDSTHVKPVIVLGKPSLCDEVLDDYFHDQIVVFNHIREADRSQEDQDGEEFEIREIIRPVDGAEQPTLIALHGQNLYTVERDSLSTTSTKPVSRTMTKRRSNGVPVQQTPLPVPVDSATSSNNDVRTGRPLEEDELPGSEIIRVGAKYSPWVLPGYGGPRFQQRIAQVIQPEWRDGRGQLIPPWKNYDLLRPGTVIMATVSINVFVMSSTAKGRPRRKTYQAAIKSLRVLGRSDIPVEKPTAILSAGAVVNQQPQEDPASLALRSLIFPDAVQEDEEAEGSSTASSGRGTGSQSSAGEVVDRANNSAASPSNQVSSSSRDGQEDQTMGEFLEDTEAQFMANTRDRKGKRVKRN